MQLLRSWRALLVREYLEHRMSFIWVPLGILVLLTVAAVSALSFNRAPVFEAEILPYSLKLFEMGYLLLLAIWLAYLMVAMFFYFGDAFHADRRNNAMLFWKSMPVSDLSILASKMASGLVLFPLIILLVGLVSGLVLFLLINFAAFGVPAIQPIEPGAALASFYEVTAFAVTYYGLSLLWYAPFFAWVGALATVFGRWSLPLAFVIPGLLAVVENIAFYGQGPQGGQVWAYLSKRWNFGLGETELWQMLSNFGLFRSGVHINALLARIDWTQMGTGLVFAAGVIWLASEYRRRRIA
jgi:ABC-2 type transport system permease protein